ncbi:MAG: hypothetical protein Q7S19_02110 [bacterium]|nr:hypothetical protein [bacterium]
MNYSKEELNEAYKKLPPELKEIFFSEDITEPINNIGRKYKLHIDQIGELDSETGFVLLGLTQPTDFVSNLTTRLGLDRITASQIASDINDQVFLKVRELLKQAKPGPAEDMPEDEVSGLSQVASREETHPTRDALLAAIENPEGMAKKIITPKVEIPLVEVRNPYQPSKPEIGKDFPVVAPVQVPADILTRKLSGQVSLPKVETRVDPYKEQV